MARGFYSNWAEEPTVETVLMDSYRWGEAGEAAAGFCLMASSPITRANIQRKGDRATERNNRKIDLPVLYFSSPSCPCPIFPTLFVLPILHIFLTPSVIPILHSLPCMCSLSYIHYPVCTH